MSQQLPALQELLHHTFVHQLKSLSSIVHLQWDVGRHARQLLEGVLQVIINVHNQQKVDKVDCRGLSLITTALHSNSKLRTLGSNMMLHEGDPSNILMLRQQLLITMQSINLYVARFGVCITSGYETL